MRAKLTRISVRRSGSIARREETIDAERIRIGRAMGNEIELSGLSVALEHAVLDRRADGVYLAPRPPAPLLRGGRRVDGDVCLADGDVIGVGPYTLRVTGLASGDSDISMELEGAPVITDTQAIAPSQDQKLERGLFTRWRLGWIAGATLFVLAFLWPLLSGRQATWSTGTISNNHASIAVECSACHEPWRPVSNDLCLECHANLGSHVDAVANHAEVDTLRCASCHTEHGGPEGLALLEDATCSDCHVDLDSRYETDLPRAADFDGLHPQFTLHLLVPGERDERGAPAVERVIWSETAEERSGLEFNHWMHVGGVRHLETGEVKNMRCDTCHVVDEGGRRMAEISFEENCRSCHALNFSLGGRDEGGQRRGRTRQAVADHGKPGELRRQLRRVFLEDALPRQPGETVGEHKRRVLVLRRPGARRSAEEQRLVDTVNRKADETFAQLMSDEYCGECHTLVPEDAPVDVAPVAVTKAWLGATRFDHSSHASTPCARCHPRAAVHNEEFAAESSDFVREDSTLPNATPYGLLDVATLRERGLEPSESASDVLVLGYDSCRECHGGSRAMPPEVASGCVMCHPYHRADRDPIVERTAAHHDPFDAWIAAHPAR